MLTLSYHTLYKPEYWDACKGTPEYQGLPLFLACKQFDQVLPVVIMNQDSVKHKEIEEFQ